MIVCAKPDIRTVYNIIQATAYGPSLHILRLKKKGPTETYERIFG